MSALQDDVDALREHKKEAILEQQKREITLKITAQPWSNLKEERSWEFNMSVLKNIYEDKRKIAEDGIIKLEKEKERYKICRKKVNKKTGLTTKIKEIDNRISQCKKSYQLEGGVYHLFKLLDERLTNIERFGMMDYGEEKNILEN